MSHNTQHILSAFLLRRSTFTHNSYELTIGKHGQMLNLTL